jgi:tetratricopeptide (TPR) repeat protein
MQIVGLEPRRSELARGIVIARSARTLSSDAQRALWTALAAAGVTEPGDGAGTDEPERRLLAAPWLPPSASELDAQREALERVAREHALEAVWFVKVETGIDGVAWLDIAAEQPREEVEEDAPDTEVVDAIFEEREEILYSAPDAPAAPPEDDAEGEAEIEAEIVHIESHWRNGLPPTEHTVTFPVERYPDIIDDYDWESFGIAIKLSGTQMAGEETAINAFFALWLSVYQDERADEFEPFQRADVLHDRRHRSALMWVEKLAVPATSAEQVNFLLWVIARLNDVLPIAWARFDTIDEAVKARASATEDEPFILAGNPFEERFRRQGEEAALAWAVAQSGWSRRELAAMLVEVALEHDPDDPATAVVAERLLRRALAFDPRSDATGYLAIVMIRQRRLGDAIALAQGAPARDVRLLVVGEMAEHAPGELGAALELLDLATLDDTEPEELADLVGSIALHAPAYLSGMLDKLPDDVALVPHLYNASFAVERPQALAILRKVLALPEPAPDAGEARKALVMSWNNACIHAHALGDYRLAAELADGGQRYAPENPYIYHSAACAYAALHMTDRALDQVARAIEYEYEHTEKMETDADLASLQADPRFPALFIEWRTKRADLN